MKVAAVQMSAVPGDVRGNLARIAAHVRAGAEAGCRLLLFPEIADLGYDMPAIAEHGPGSWPLVKDTLRELAATYAVCLVCGVCLPDGAGRSNALVVFGPDGSILARYRKIHLFAAGDADETGVFTPGSRIESFELDGLRFGLSICYDLRFPELFRVQALDGCHALLLASAWPRARLDIWDALCVARAVENQCYLLAANLVGDRGVFPFGGHSVFVTPAGRATRADDRSEGLTCGEIAPEEIAAARRAIPALSHRRPDLYAGVMANPAPGL